MSTIVAPQSTLPPVDCAPWCQDGDGHTDEHFPDDQYCSSETVRVPLTRHKMLDVGDGSWQLDEMRAWILRERFEANASIQLIHDGKRWYVLSLIWRAEDAKLQLPERYLRKG